MALEVKSKDVVELEVTGPGLAAPRVHLGKIGSALVKHLEQYPDLLRSDITSSAFPTREDL